MMPRRPARCQARSRPHQGARKLKRCRKVNGNACEPERVRCSPQTPPGLQTQPRRRRANCALLDLLTGVLTDWPLLIVHRAVLAARDLLPWFAYAGGQHDDGRVASVNRHYRCDQPLARRAPCPPRSRKCPLRGNLEIAEYLHSSIRPFCVFSLPFSRPATAQEGDAHMAMRT